MKLVDARTYKEEIPKENRPQDPAFAELVARQERLALEREREYLEALGLTIESLQPRHIESLPLLEMIAMFYRTFEKETITIRNDGRYGRFWTGKDWYPRFPTCYFSLDFYPSFLVHPAINRCWEETTYDSLHIYAEVVGTWNVYIVHH